MASKRRYKSTHSVPKRDGHQEKKYIAMKDQQDAKKTVEPEQLSGLLCNTTYKVNNPSTNWQKFLQLQKKSGSSDGSNNNSEQVTSASEGQDERLTNIIGMDCEMVGIEGGDSMLGRVSLVNKSGTCIYDKFVRPREKVVDYRTFVSGIRPHNLKSGEDFQTVQKEVADIIKDRILVGHALRNDLKVLYLSHPRFKIRDTARYRPFKMLGGGKTPSLRFLAQEILGITIQKGEHSSVQDAQAALKIYLMYRKEWEANLQRKGKKAPSTFFQRQTGIKVQHRKASNK